MTDAQDAELRALAPRLAEHAVGYHPNHPIRNDLIVVADALPALLDERDDVAATFRRVLDEKCPTDEVHCTCVPVLRQRIAELEAQLGAAMSVVADLSEFIRLEGWAHCESAPTNARKAEDKQQLLWEKARATLSSAELLEPGPDLGGRQWRAMEAMWRIR